MHLLWMIPSIKIYYQNISHNPGKTYLVHHLSATPFVFENTFYVFSRFSQGIFEVNEVSLNSTICPRHRDCWGIRWRSNKKNCSCPEQWIWHQKNSKGDRGINLAQSRALFSQTQLLLPIGSRKCLSIMIKFIILLNFGVLEVWKKKPGDALTPLPRKKHKQTNKQTKSKAKEHTHPEQTKVKATYRIILLSLYFFTLHIVSWLAQCDYR